MSKTFRRDFRGKKIIYRPVIEDPYDMDIGYLIRLFDQTLDDVYAHHQKYPYGGREYILTGNKECVEILQQAFEDYKKGLKTITKYQEKGFLAGLFGGLLVGTSLVLLTKEPLLFFIFTLGMIGGDAIGAKMDGRNARIQERRREAVEYLLIRE